MPCMPCFHRTIDCIPLMSKGQLQGNRRDRQRFGAVWEKAGVTSAVKAVPMPRRARMALIGIARHII